MHHLPAKTPFALKENFTENTIHLNFIYLLAPLMLQN